MGVISDNLDRHVEREETHRIVAGHPSRREYVVTTRVRWEAARPVAPWARIETKEEPDRGPN